TFRMVMLSYLHELAPKEFQDQYFPFKPTTAGDNTENNLTTPILANLGRINSSGMYTPEELIKNWALKSGAILDDSSMKQHEATPEEMKALFPDEREKDRVRQTFEIGEKLQKQLFSEIEGSHPTQTNIHFFLESMLNTQNGETFIKNYVLVPEVIESRDDKKIIGYERNAMQFFRGIENDTKTLLETRSVHKSRVEEAKQQALQKN